MGYYGKDKFIDWDPVKNQRYLKSDALDKLFEENEKFASIFNSTIEKKFIFDAMQTEMDRGKKKLTNEGMLRAIGKAYQKKKLVRYQVEQLLKDLFPRDTIPRDVQNELIFDVESTEEIETEAKEEAPENQPSGSEAENNENPEPKKGFLTKIGF